MHNAKTQAETSALCDRGTFHTQLIWTITHYLNVGPQLDFSCGSRGRGTTSLYKGNNIKMFEMGQETYLNTRLGIWNLKKYCLHYI